MSGNSPVIFKHGHTLLQPPKMLAAFIAKLTAGITPRKIAEDKRSEPRYTLSTIVEVQAVDEQLKPVGDVFKAVTRDISAGGIGLTHNREIQSKRLALQLTNAEGDTLQTLVEVIRCQPYKNTWDIGGKFITQE